MFDVQAANFKSGIFEIHLNKPFSLPVIKHLVALGPIKGRLIGLAGLVFALLLGINKAPSRFILENGWAKNVTEALVLQEQIMWIFVGISAAFYLISALFRESHLEIDFDRHKESLSYYLVPHFVFSPKREGTFLFKDIRNIQVYSPERQPKTSHGYIRIQGPVSAPPIMRNLEFTFLTEEQRRFFPLNINRLTDIEPQGDWEDPGDPLPPTPPN